ncbi:hypothetical protein BDD12DRAFT_800966 [Trichophaea hybrida]|nr:hypothetical protein BDD12DRAFT_800966 [Trichophaea hybrida]
MSSIFTYNPSPPKPASPWAVSPSSSPRPPLDDDPEQVMTDVPGHLKASSRVRSSFITGDRSGGDVVAGDGEPVRGLAAEPQIGPTEYKLSLVRGGKSEQRLEQLTTQLLWRLQQSTSYHGTGLASKSPEAISSLLQESKGALYEIGIADDGAFVGLEEEELEASLDVLRTIAEKLGAYVTVTRRVYIKTVEERDVELAKAKLAEHLLARARGKAKNGRGKYLKEVPDIVDYEVDPADVEKFHIPKLGSKLYVAEALIKPYDGTNGTVASRSSKGLSAELNPTQQLRISLTGPTMCGKSTLLGTLTTGDFDNGRGKSRLSLLRHRHELVTGVTSSVAWGIVGYKPEGSKVLESEGDEDCGFLGAGEDEPVLQDAMSRVVNYATGNISSWTDIHSAAEGGRIVFMSDSAGQLKYRRTTVRSLVGWAPHYASLLIPANDCDTKDRKPGLSEDSLVHMELCIKLDLPLIVVFTKMDVASKPGLRAVLSSTLSKLKARGKRPLMVQNSGKIQETVDAIAAEPNIAVPIIFTSAVKGDGINLIHELLMKLPMPTSSSAVNPLPRTSLAEVTKKVDNLAITGSDKDIDLLSRCGGVEDDEPDSELTTLFHVEEVYGMKPSVNSDQNSGGSVISGHVRYGTVSIGDKLMVGPFHSGGEPGHRSRSTTPTPTLAASGTSPLPISAGSNNLLSRSPESGEEGQGRSPLAAHIRGRRGDYEEDEWKLVRVVSVRRLRLPVTSLFAGEAGTIGIIPIEDETPALRSPVDVSEKMSEILITATEAKSTGGTVLTVLNAVSQPIDINQDSSLGDKKAVTFASPPLDTYEPEELHLRKGFVILNRSTKPGKELWMKAYTGFTAELNDDEAAAQSLLVGSDVIVYIASVRAVARIVSVDPPPSQFTERERKDNVDMFGFDDDEDQEDEELDVRASCKRRFGFEFLGVEWIEKDAKVLVMKNQGHSGMEVFVGTVVNRIREVG